MTGTLLRAVSSLIPLAHFEAAVTAKIDVRHDHVGRVHGSELDRRLGRVAALAVEAGFGEHVGHALKDFFLVVDDENQRGVLAFHGFFMFH